MNFERLLLKAKEGNADAVLKILEIYKPLVRSWKVNVGIPIFRISVMICLEGQNSLMENVKALFFCNA